MERLSIFMRNWLELSKNSLRIIMKIESKRHWIRWVQSNTEYKIGTNKKHRFLCVKIVQLFGSISSSIAYLNLELFLAISPPFQSKYCNFLRFIIYLKKEIILVPLDWWLFPFFYHINYFFKSFNNLYLYFQ